jgi:hypothetical protein
VIDLLWQALQPFQATTYETATRLFPRVLAALLLLIFAWAAAKIARWMTRRAARAEWLERMLLRSGVLQGLVEPSRTETRRLVENTIYWCILLSGAGAALAVVSDQIAARLATLVLIQLPNLLLAFAIITTGWWLGGYWARSVLIAMANEGIPYPWRWAAAIRMIIVATGVALASEATGFATPLIRTAYLILLSGGTLAVGYASVPMLRAHFRAMLPPNGTAGPANHADDSLVR